MLRHSRSIVDWPTQFHHVHNQHKTRKGHSAQESYSSVNYCPQYRDFTMIKREPSYWRLLGVDAVVIRSSYGPNASAAVCGRSGIPSTNARLSRLWKTASRRADKRIWRSQLTYINKRAEKDSSEPRESISHELDLQKLISGRPGEQTCM